MALKFLPLGDNTVTTLPRVNDLAGRNRYPRVHRTPEVYDVILDAGSRVGYIGHDLEYTQRGEPYLSSLAAGGRAAATSWNLARPYLAEAVRRGLDFAGHAWITADKPILERELGVVIPLERAQDTMILHYLANADLCKGEQKNEDAQDNRGAGYMDCWSMSSIYTDLPQWKRCRDGQKWDEKPRPPVHCAGPCPVHDPVGYNGLDAVSPYLALPELRDDLAAKGVTSERIHHAKRLSVICERMKEQKIKVDLAEVHRLDNEIRTRKDELFGAERRHKIGKKGQPLKATELVWNSPFSPRSPSQVTGYFRGEGVALRSASKEDAAAMLKHFPDAAPEAVREWLQRYHDYKDAGKGLKPWFDDQYIDAFGFIHPRFIVCATSTGRLASSGPNLQNIPKRGWGKQIRRVIVPRDAGLRLLKADCRQLELRMVLWDAGVTEDFGDDAFTWLVQQAPELFSEASRVSPLGHGPRDVAKRVSHAGSMMEGFDILYADDLAKTRTTEAIRAGALRVHRDWEYAGGVVAFTGVNLARGLFGDASYESRKKALEIQDVYFGRFPQIRVWQRRCTAEAERGYSLNRAGHYLKPRGDARDKAKICASNRMQGTSAIYVQESMLRYDEAGYTPLINLHDELVFEVPREWSDKRCYDFMQVMAEPSRVLDGFRCPVEVKAGDNWLECEEIKV